MKKRTMLMLLSFALAIALANVNAQEVTGVNDRTVCCEKTKSGLFCQDVPETACDASSRKSPTSCESTSFCKTGFCFDSAEGTCLDNTPQLVCSQNDGTWNAAKPAQCELGCCILGDQASFVTLTRCKRLSSFFGLETNYNPSIKDEAQCILSVSGREKGACVFEQDFELTCKFTNREDCTTEKVLSGVARTASGNATGQIEGLVRAPAQSGGVSNGSITGQAVSVPSGQVEFFAGKLCSAEELGTNCGLTKQTTCVEGKEEVYFIDTCGNPANIYDASKINNKDYWGNIEDRSESCNPNSGNANSQTCGNCNYLLGSYCREASLETANPTYGNNICASLNCIDKSGKQRLHGESWCSFDSPQSQDSGRNPVGSKYFRSVCNNGEVLIEPCAEFRQEECIENSVETSAGRFAEAACRVNRWQDCTAQTDREDCENEDRRDCKWFDGIQYILMGRVANGTSLDTNSLAEVRKSGSLKNIPKGACVPSNPPGLNFWSGEEAAGICSQANAVCIVTYEKGIGGDWECKENCECLSQEVLQAREQICTAMGDCGPNVNWVGQRGQGELLKFSQEKIRD